MNAPNETAALADLGEATCLRLYQRLEQACGVRSWDGIGFCVQPTRHFLSGDIVAVLFNNGQGERWPVYGYSSKHRMMIRGLYQNFTPYLAFDFICPKYSIRRGYFFHLFTLPNVAPIRGRDSAPRAFVLESERARLGRIPG